VIDRSLVVVLLSALPLSVFAAKDVWLDLGAGFDQQWHADSNASGEDASVQSLDARFNTIWHPQAPLEFGLQYGLEQRAILAGNATDTEPTTADFRVADLDAVLVEDDDVALYQNLDRTDDDEEGLRLTVGFDQQLWRDIYLQFEYHFNGLGADDSDDYSELANSDFYRSGLVLPLGRHYTSVQVSGSLGALYQFQLGSETNLLDGSQLSTASLVRSLGDNTELTLALTLPAEIEKVDSNSSTEFGVYPTVFSVNWSTVF